MAAAIAAIGLALIAGLGSGDGGRDRVTHDTRAAALAVSNDDSLEQTAVGSLHGYDDPRSSVRDQRALSGSTVAARAGGALPRLR